MANKNSDPLSLHELDPSNLQAQVENRKAKPVREVDVEKEKRLSMKEKRLADQAQKAPMQAPMSGSQDTAVEEEFDKAKVIDKILAYRERFPFLKKRNNISGKSSHSEVADELHYVEMQLGAKQDTSLGSLLFHSTLAGVEHVHYRWNPLGLNLQGLSLIGKDNYNEFEPIVDELMIKYGGAVYLPPELRLCFALGGLMFTVHAANSGDSTMASVLQRVNAPMKVPQSGDKL